MNEKLRRIIFWLHLCAGLTAGAVILIMCVTGVALAFEKEIVAWAERDVRHVAPAHSTRLSLDELLARVREKKPGERPSGITLDADPNAALLISFGRTNSLYVNPYTGAVSESGGRGARAFMQTMIEWHRYLGGHDGRRATGKAVTGACNAAFLFLAISGLCLWWPRQWTKSALRAVSLMHLELRGKARDWNWHNAVGLWCAPVLIVLTATALPISYRWAGDLIYQLTGTPPPALGSGPGAAPAVEVPQPPPGTSPLGLEDLFSTVQKESPGWKQITLQTGAARPRAPRGAETASNKGTGEPLTGTDRSRSRAEAGTSGGGEERRPGPQAVIATVRVTGQWPIFAPTQISLDPFTGAVLRKEAFNNYNLGRKVRSWTRFLHTGEALGALGKAVAGLASAGAVLLVWTGIALACRRFFTRQTDAAISEESGPQAAAKE